MAAAASLHAPKTTSTPRWVLYAVSAIAHVALAVLIFAYPVHKPKKFEKVAVAIHETKKAKPPEPVKPPEPPKAEPPPPPAPKAAAPKALAPPKAAPAAAPAAVASAVPDLGMVGGGPGGNGPVLPAAGGPTREADSSKPPAPHDECAEGPTKAKRVEGPQPTYTQEAREAEVEGVVKIEVTIDESGKVVSAKIVVSLGHGLDEAALEAAREWQFEAATRCGKAIAGSSTLPFRFKLDS